MADAAISFAVEKLGDALIQKLGDALIHKVNFLRDVKNQVRWLKDELESMRCFLKDAAEKQGQDESIRKWIRDVREVAQDAEDVIEIFTLKLDAPTRKRDLVRKWAGFPVHVSNLNRVGKEIKSIRTRLDEIVKRRERYGIRNLGEVGVESSSFGSRLEMVEMQRLILNDKDVVGLDQVTDLLLKEVILDDKKKGLSLAAIVGMGGSGKSTLARKIYNNPAVAARFEQRVWVVVSSEFVAEDIMKQIMHELSVPLNKEELETLASIKGTLRRQEMLQQMLRKRLEGKRYFIVLDDVWEPTHWELALKSAFPDEQDKGSRLLFTSRNQIITEHSGYVHKMNLLSSEESWQLLLKTAFNGKNEERCPRELEEIGREILEKCHGLPLAITVAGGLLMNQGMSKSRWEIVLKQIKHYLSEASESGKNVSAILELSYRNLPSELKPCFLCLAFFKEDEVIRARRLVHIWAALGLIQAGEESVEEIGRRYLDRLIKRNLILVKQMCTDDRVKYCYVHDLLLELSIKKAKEEIGFESLGQGSSSSSKPRHRVVRGIQVDETLYQNKHLRTLFLHVPEVIFDADNVTISYLKGFELLRILDIECSILRKFPPKIRALIGIRYLRLRAKDTVWLPSWLDVLKNLEVLDMAECYKVIFPDVIWKMDSLRHFYMSRFCILPKNMKKSSWKNLETLEHIDSSNLVSGDNPIQGFSRLLHKLGILGFGLGKRRAAMWRLIDESAVQVVHFQWFDAVNSPLPIPNSLDHVTKLKLKGRMDSFPCGADNFPQNITQLTLSRSRISGNDAVQNLSKLPNLLILKLDDAFTFGTRLVKVSHDGFPRLKVLHIRNMILENIEIEEGGMSQLQRLEIYKCPDLEKNDNLRKRIRPAKFIILAEVIKRYEPTFTMPPDVLRVPLT